MNRAAAASQGSSGLHVSKAGLWWSADTAAPGDAIDVEVDGARLWSGHVPDLHAGAHQLDWPRALRPFLRGSGSIVVRSSTDGERIASGPYRFAAASVGRTLQGLVTAGTIVDKWGKLATAASRELHEALLDGAERVIAELESGGYTVAITGGTLLGAVRVGAILDRDDDADLVLYLGESTPADVSVESYRIERLLEETGHEVVRHSDAHLQVLFPRTDHGITAHVDVFLGYHDHGVYCQPIHVRAPVAVESIVPLRRIELEGRSFPSVADADAWLAACYGPEWRTPDPAFVFETPMDTRRRYENWYGTYDFTRHHWEADARTRDSRRSTQGDSDVRVLLRRTNAGDAILDLGAGVGAQSAALADAGRVVTAVDFALAAVDAARVLSNGRFRVERANFAQGREVMDLIERHGGRGDVSVLLSDVIAYLPKASRAIVFRMIRALLGDRGVVVASFPDRESRRYEHLRPDTWHLPLPWLREELEPFGLEFTLIRRSLRRTPIGVRRFAQVSIRAVAPLRRDEETFMARLRKMVKTDDVKTEAPPVLETPSGGDSTVADERLATLETSMASLRMEIDELRQDSRRIAELYDLVVEHLGRERSGD
ncbi:class I SAM-dependent methyltransferase [Agromyces sp. Marseille-Q5079]|uniref:class I SAM-dependent methyltransferase n=1 Tax=Agromyces sp. Marseille-Q5079 TaxID=3439059 RepID=UPI003D9C8D06